MAEVINKSRERVALVIFFILIILGGIVLTSYFLTGRSWSVAATVVDDTVGSLEDYNVVVFNGVIEDKTSPATQAKDEKMPPSDNTDTAFAEVTDKSNLGDRIMSTYKRFDLQNQAKDDKVYASDVREIYELKGADVLTLNLANIDYYKEPQILKTKDKTYGIFSISSYTSRAQVKSIISDFKDEDVDNIICITPRSALLSTYDGIDVVVLTEEPNIETQDDDTKNTLQIVSPYVGTTGAILFTSNNIPSYKVIEEL